SVLSMGLVPAGMGAAARGLSMANVPGLACAAAVSVVLAAGLIVGETAMFRPAAELTAWSAFATRMMAFHLWIGAIEGVATAGIVGIALAAARHKPAIPRLALGLAAAAILAALMLPISSSLPDGYEAAAEGR